MDITNRVALVTGGAHRLGRAIALALADAGARIALHYHQSAGPAQDTLAELHNRGTDAFTLAGDLAQVAEAERIIDTAYAHWGRLDILISSAGIWGRTPLGDATEETWDRLFAVNTRSPFFMAQRAAPYLRAVGGCIVAITDIGVEWTWKGYTPYLSSKASMAMVVQNLACDLAPAVRVNAVAPGPVLLPDDWTADQHEQSARSTLLGRVGRAEDIAEAILYLVRADYVTGVILPVDGGQRLK